jgi:hypothetical protein
MVKEGYVEKMQAYKGAANSNHLHSNRPPSAYQNKNH